MKANDETQVVEVSRDNPLEFESMTEEVECIGGILYKCDRDS